MLEKAMARFDIDATRSYFIGDAERDMIAGEKAGLQTIRVEINQSLMEIAGRIL